MASGSRTPREPDEATLDLRCRWRQRAPGRDQVEGDPGRQQYRDRQSPRQRPPPRERAGQPEQRQQQEDLRAGEHGKPERAARRPFTAPRVQHERRHHQQRGQRDLHAGECAPRHRPGERDQHGREDGDIVTAGPDRARR
jgi:hypothetical protein